MNCQSPRSGTRASLRIGNCHRIGPCRALADRRCRRTRAPRVCHRAGPTARRRRQCGRRAGAEWRAGGLVGRRYLRPQCAYHDGVEEATFSEGGQACFLAFDGCEGKILLW